MKKYYKPFLICSSLIVLSVFVMGPETIPPDADKPNPLDRNSDSRAVKTDSIAVKTDSTARGKRDIIIQTGNTVKINPKGFTPEPEKKPTGNKANSSSGNPKAFTAEPGKASVKQNKTALKPLQQTNSLFKHSRNSTTEQQTAQSTTKQRSNKNSNPEPLIKPQNGATSIKQLPVDNQQQKSGGSSSDSQGSWNW